MLLAMLQVSGGEVPAGIVPGMTQPNSSRACLFMALGAPVTVRSGCYCLQPVAYKSH